MDLMDRVVVAPQVEVAKFSFLVLRDEPEGTTEAGLTNPNPEVKKTGVVVRVGPGVPDHIQAGVRIGWIFENSHPIRIGEEEYLLMTETEDACDYAVIFPDRVEVVDDGD